MRRAEEQRKIDQPIWGDRGLGESEGRWCCEGPGIGGDRTGNTSERERAAPLNEYECSNLGIGATLAKASPRYVTKKRNIPEGT